MPRRALPPRAPERRESAAARGYGRQWRKARAAYLAVHPLCVMCEAAGDVTPATVVDHRVHHEGPHDRLFWDQENWQSLCKRCHDRKTARERGWGKRK
jgi:5-methylcytosine-specific restriction enzyme A